MNLKESVRHKHEDSKVDYSVGECCFDRLTWIAERGLREGSMLHRARGGGRDAIYVPYGDVPPIRVYFLAFESETGCFLSLTLKQGAKFVRSLRARVPIHSTVWHPPIGFNLFVFWPGN